ncbi:Rpn family recombination-promoting nuclease/putative transposase [Hutsoniella sourekii]|uniref:Rpn family recombination-promoting nuclease/putative transposase n=1 Tax=Hutsoniella sourekii TaxID=87650 RepID=UPI0004824181|nr:Rpn family recombination-promoting nuclease/putative transposase [Hutsoniella sourekii]
MRFTATDDLIFKKVFTENGNERILKKFIETVLGRTFARIQVGNPYTVKAYQAQFEALKEKGRLKALLVTIVDIKAWTQEGEVVLVEMQRQATPYYFERALLYACQAYSENYGRIHQAEGNKYANLKAVYQINVTQFNLFGRGSQALEPVEFYASNYHEPINHLWQQTSSRGQKRDLQAIYLYFFSLVSDQFAQGQEDLKAWQSFFLTNQVPADAPAELQAASRIVSQINVEKGEEYEMLSELEKIEDDLNWTEWAWTEYGRQEGRHEGLIEGRLEGEKLGQERGRVEGRQSLIRELYDNGMDLSALSQFTKLSEADLRDLLNS